MSLYIEIASVLIIALVAIFLVETVAALFSPPNRPVGPARLKGKRIAALIPAHDESVGIQSCINELKTQLLPGDHLLVVADNCSDDTATIASEAGANVIERRDVERTGKGYALHFGLRYLEADPPDVVIVIDADCQLGPRAIEHLTNTCRAKNRPI